MAEAHSQVAVAEAHDGAALVAHQFDDFQQQAQADSFGMWIFLATEVLFFGGLFCGYALYRNLYFEAFTAGSHLIKVAYGAFYTVLLICSSLTMALGVRAAQLRNRTSLMVYLALTWIMGAAFVYVKLRYEWYGDYLEGLVPGLNFAPHGESLEIINHFHATLPHVALFFVFYFCMTGLHALHMVVGVGLLTTLMIFTMQGKTTEGNYNWVEIVGLYWHFVDIVWIFLFPLLYLIGGRYL
ncbi:MAG TPA: cytochrome c oxidase subunit 3 [Terriglobia bacterium]|nr:cytochrome c oxidase subunit 3 [Terriglobia bacterium]